MTSSSVVGNAADLRDGQILLPGFISQRPDGLYIDLLAIDSRGLITQFVERVFAAGARFVDLDYELFQNLLFLWEPADINSQLEALKAKGRSPLLRLAADIAAFPAERCGIYHGVKITEGGKAAEYIFEPVSVERVEADPEAPDGSGKRTVVERLYADFDEFVAALWSKGVRFGIDATAVREAIARDKPERLTIAHVKPPTEGKDASVAEQSNLLHRDDAPQLLPSGRMDLRHYRNRFPQVAEGTRLFKKVKRLAGVSGWDVQGRELEPGAVNDFDIQTLSGPGTRVDRDESGEYVLAAINGFLDIDAQSGQVSVVDKIVSREGVSMRTTGDLSLAGDEYEEHGEVQERRVVEGHNMTFLADIFGNIMSDGGRILMKQNISGGTAHSPGGSVTVEGSASRALLEARRGEVTVSRAEDCVIIADRVRIERAVRCTIVADEVDIEISEGSAIAAKTVVLKHSTLRRDEATVVTLLLPDLTHYDRDLLALQASRQEAEADVARCSAALELLSAKPELRSYIAIQAKLKAKTLTMTPAQKPQWEALLDRVTPILRQVAALKAEIQAGNQGLAETVKEFAELKAARRQASQGVSCSIEAVEGDTQVRSLRQAFDEAPLASLSPKSLQMRLREAGTGTARLFSGASGSFEWQPPAEDESADAEASPGNGPGGDSGQD